MHCWVNKGAKGIALIDEDSFSGLKYVFDISDVHKARRIGQFPNLWEMREEHMESVISRLEKIYGDTDREAGLCGINAVGILDSANVPSPSFLHSGHCHFS